MKNSYRIIAPLALLTLLVVLVVSLSFWSFKQIETAAEARTHTSTVIGKADDLLSALIDAETGQRGYLLTGDEAFLQTYLAVHDGIKGQLELLRQLSKSKGADKNLESLVPLIDSKLRFLAKNIELRRNGDQAAAVVNVRSSHGKPLMDSIRAELNSFTMREKAQLVLHETEFHSYMNRLYIIIAVASLLILMLALSFAYLLHRETEQRLKNLVHLETKHLLEVQEGTNKQLQQVNATLQESGETTQKLVSELEVSQIEMEAQNTEMQRAQQELENQQIELEMQNDELRLAREAASELEKTLRDNEEQLSVTLNSIGDAVIATDFQACVTRLNPVAEQLTGWTKAEAVGRPIDDIFHIVNKETRQPAPIPVMDAIAHGTVQGLANHTVLIARDGSEYDVADSCAPIRNRNNDIVGAVLVFRNVTEEYVVQQSLRDSAALMRAILNTVVDGIITIHAQGGIIETVNPAAELMFGYSSDELDGQNFSLLIPELDQDQRNGSLEYYSASEEALASGHGREVLGRRKDGSFFPLELSASEMHLGGQRYFTGILRDTTARKQAEEALLKAGALQNAIFNSANFSSIATDAKGVIQIFNVGAERMLGYTAAEVMDKITPADISDPQEVIARAEALSIELETPIAPGFEALAFKASRGIEDIYELTYIRKDGSRFPAVVSVTALRDAQSAIIGYLLIGTDNTARKEAEEALFKAGALQSAIFNSANFSSIATDAKGVIQIFNVGAERMLGYTAAEVMDKITPADISDPQEVIARAEALSIELETQITPGFEALVFKASRGIEDIYELTYIRKDGSRFPAVVSVTALRDDQDGIIGYLLIGTDNTARKEAEEALLQAGALQSAIFNSANFSSIATDAKGVIQIFNVGAERMLGYTAAEVMDKITPADISDPQEVIARAEELSIELGTPITPGFEALVFKASRGIEDIYELTYIRKDGSRFPAVVSVTALRDAQSAIIGYLLIGTDNTARKEAEEALLQAGALQSAIFNSANFSSIATDAKGVIQIFNVGAERMLGYTAAEVMDKITPADISDPQEVIARAEALSIELETQITPGFEALVFKASRGIEDIYELTYIRKDGSRFPAVVSVTALRDAQSAIIGYLLIGTDNTARKEAEEALLKAGALQSAIFNSANFSSIATDAKGVIQIFNVGAERMLGYTAAEVMDKITPADISDPQEVIARAEELSIELGTPITPGFEALVFKASREIEDIYELTYIRKDGSRFPAVVSVTALRDALDSIIGYLLIGTDNTARKQVEAERIRLEQVLQDKNIELERATLVAEKANLAKSDFLSSMSHELRTPLSAILGFAQLMESGSPQPSPSQKRSIDQILKAGWYLLELINEILDLAVIESGKLSMSLEPVSLSEIIHECETMVEPQAKKHGISVTFIHFETPCFVKADRTRVKQVLINLLSNSIKYNKTGGSVLVDSAMNGSDSVRISVRDTGEGLTPEKIAQLFQPFNRLGQEANAEQGTGIGLVVCKRLVEWMGGIIGVESTVGVGSVFWIELNLTAEPQEVAHEVNSVIAGQTPSQGAEQQYTLLYVEDNPANLMLVEDIIERRPDIRLLSARDGKSGIELARASLPDVILMDIHLPGISGIDAMKILVADQTTAHIPVVALSANAIPRDIEKGLEAGFFRYLTKPINVNEFMDTLDVTLKYAKERAARAAKE